ARGHRHDRDRTPFVARSDSFERDIVGVFVGEAAQKSHQFFVAIKTRVIDGRHGTSGEGKAGDDTGGQPWAAAVVSSAAMAEQSPSRIVLDRAAEKRKGGL